MNLFNDYFLKYTDKELQYYAQQGLEFEEVEFLYKPFLNDLQGDKLTLDDASGFVNELTDTQKKKLFGLAEDLLDLFDPDEKLLDLLDMLDPNYSL